MTTSRPAPLRAPSEPERTERQRRRIRDPFADDIASRGYYTLAGSLTTPPCTEGVTWYVLKAPVEISPGQIAAFAKRYPMNARPVQPLSARRILETRD